MKINKVLADLNRWHLMAYPSTKAEAQALRSWMHDSCPECICQYRFNSGVNPYWELRGGDFALQMLILMTWGD
jgi:hypothetical protein